jgi:hypothetical protein
MLKHRVLILMLIDGMDYAGNFEFCLEPFGDRGLTAWSFKIPD